MTGRRTNTDSGPAWAWPVAHRLGATRWTCWSELVSWATDRHRPRNRRDRRLMSSATWSGAECRRQVATGENEVCYCGKYRTPAVHAAMGYPDGGSWQIVRPDPVDELLAVTARRVPWWRTGGLVTLAALAVLCLAVLR